MMTAIRNLEVRDREQWEAQWSGYCAFYEADVPAHVTEATWGAVVDSARPVIGRGAFSADGSLLGFSLSVLHASTWQIEQSCYLEDLFVDPSRRSAGVGRTLIDDLADLCRKNGWGRLYWHTRVSNAAARRLYDHYAQAEDFVRYRLEF